MASWFSTTTFTDLKNKVQSSVTNLANDPDLLSKLTLNSPELAAERDRIDNEEKRKEQVKDALAEILPWETRDEELEILVEECKDVILGLSSSEESFTGPFVLVGGLAREEEEDEDDDEEEYGARGKTSAKDLEAAQQSAEKLSKLQPLPKLLSEFDLDTHVGLIQRLFKEDPKLVGMHSKLSSGGEKEVTFWKNYFFHCAYARYEAGLSIDEIWSSEHGAGTGGVVTGSGKRSALSGKSVTEEEDYNIVDTVGNPSQDEEEVTFDSASSVASRDSSYNDNVVKSSSAASSEEKLFSSHPSLTTSATPATSKLTAPASPGIKPNQDTPESYEFVSDDGGDDDGSMDELEAEIAAALGD